MNDILIISNEREEINMTKDLKPFMGVILTLVIGYFIMRFLLGLVISLSKVTAVALVIALMLVYVAEIVYTHNRKDK